MTTIAFTGTSPAVEAVRHRLTSSPLPFEIVDDADHTDFVVTAEPAPVPNHLGVVSTLAPSTFFATDDSVGYILDALTEAYLIAAFGVVVRAPIQNNPVRPRKRLWRRRPDPLEHFDSDEFDWATEETVDIEVFDDVVQVTAGGQEFDARLRARGYMDTNDGRFHWAGMLYGEQARALKEDGKSKATVSYRDTEAVPAKLAEITQWGVVRMTGVGTPPWVAAEEAALTGG